MFPTHLERTLGFFRGNVHVSYQFPELKVFIACRKLRISSHLYSTLVLPALYCYQRSLAGKALILRGEEDIRACINEGAMPSTSRQVGIPTELKY